MPSPTIRVSCAVERADPRRLRLRVEPAVERSAGDARAPRHARGLLRAVAAHRGAPRGRARCERADLVGQSALHLLVEGESRPAPGRRREKPRLAARPPPSPAGIRAARTRGRPEPPDPRPSRRTRRPVPGHLASSSPVEPPSEAPALRRSARPAAPARRVVAAARPCVRSAVALGRRSAPGRAPRAVRPHRQPPAASGCPVLSKRTLRTRSARSRKLRRRRRSRAAAAPSGPARGRAGAARPMRAGAGHRPGSRP